MPPIRETVAAASPTTSRKGGSEAASLRLECLAAVQDDGGTQRYPVVKGLKGRSGFSRHAPRATATGRKDAVEPRRVA